MYATVCSNISSQHSSLTKICATSSTCKVLQKPETCHICANLPNRPLICKTWKFLQWCCWRFQPSGLLQSVMWFSSYWCWRGTSCLIFEDRCGTVPSSETSETVYQSTWLNIPEDFNLQLFFYLTFTTLLTLLIYITRIISIWKLILLATGHLLNLVSNCVRQEWWRLPGNVRQLKV